MCLWFEPFRTSAPTPTSIGHLVQSREVGIEYRTCWRGSAAHPFISVDSRSRWAFDRQIQIRTAWLRVGFEVINLAGRCGISGVAALERLSTGGRALARAAWNGLDHRLNCTEPTQRGLCRGSGTSEGCLERPLPRRKPCKRLSIGGRAPVFAEGNSIEPYQTGTLGTSSCIRRCGLRLCSGQIASLARWRGYLTRSGSGFRNTSG